MALHSGEMVKAALRDKGMTQAELARRIGRNQTLISRYLSGQIEISEGAARSIAEELDTDFEELRRQLEIDKLSRQVRRLRAAFRRVLVKEREIHISGEVFQVGAAVLVGPDTMAVPLRDSIPSEAHDQSEEELEEYILPPGVQVDPERAFALKISGENMTDDEVDEGDIIVVDPSAEMQDGDRVVVVIGGEPILRRMYISKGETIVLQSPGDREKPVIFLSERDEFKIMGRVVLLTRLFVR